VVKCIEEHFVAELAPIW